jgi:hypothetical protein
MTVKEYVSISALGGARGLAAQMVIYPLESIRNLQHLQGGRSWSIASNVIKQEGLQGLYSGFRYKALTTGVKQLWTWPLMKMIPHKLDALDAPPLLSQAVTGVTIATVDTVLTPLEKLRISTLTNTLKSLNIFKGQDFVTNWRSLSISWGTFLVGQKFFRDLLREGDKKLTHQQLIASGVLTSTAVAVIGNYPEVLKTVRMAGVASQVKVTGYFRGFPLRFTSLTIQNLFSLYLLELLGI